MTKKNHDGKDFSAVSTKGTAEKDSQTIDGVDRSVSLKKTHKQTRRYRHTRLQWLEKFAKHPNCYFCGVALTLETATKDHLTPVCREGTEAIENIVPACLPCNQMKAWRTEAEFKIALPRLSTTFPKSRSNTKSKPCIALEDRLDESGLLKTVINERERISWAWKNPA